MTRAGTEWDDDTANEAAAEEWSSVDDVDQVPTGTDTPAAPPTGEDLCYSTLDEFVEDYLATVLWFDTSTSRIWCPEWWRHAGAVARLEALHRAFEALRLDPGLGMSDWFLQHADPTLAALTNPAGPFKGCGSDRGHDKTRVRVVTVSPTPAGMFAPED